MKPAYLKKRVSEFLFDWAFDFNELLVQSLSGMGSESFPDSDLIDYLLQNFKTIQDLLKCQAVFAQDLLDLFNQQPESSQKEGLILNNAVKAQLTPHAEDLLSYQNRPLVVVCPSYGESFFDLYRIFHPDDAKEYDTEDDE